MPRTKPGRTGVVLEVLAAGRPRLRAHLPRHQARSARSVRIRRAAAGARARRPPWLGWYYGQGLYLDGAAAPAVDDHLLALVQRGRGVLRKVRIALCGAVSALSAANAPGRDACNRGHARGLYAAM
jgi:hypothetical protein